MVAPLTAAVFVAVIQVAYLLALRTAVQSAAHSGARVAATLGSDHERGEQAARTVLADQGLVRTRASFQWEHVSLSGVDFVDLTIDVPIEVPWVGQTVVLHGSALVIDENAL